MSKSKYLVITKLNTVENQSEIYSLNNKKTKDYLGTIEYYPPFHKFSFIPDSNTVWDENCLEDVLEHIKKLNNHATNPKF